MARSLIGHIEARQPACASHPGRIVRALLETKAASAKPAPVAPVIQAQHPKVLRERTEAGTPVARVLLVFMPRNIARATRFALPAAARLARLAPSVARERLLQRMLARIEHPELRERVYREFQGHDPASLIQATHALSGFSSHDWIGTVDVPTAVIVTTRDELVPPERQRKLAESIPGAEVFEVDGDHAACVARADSFVPALLDACRGVERRAGG